MKVSKQIVRFNNNFESWSINSSDKSCSSLITRSIMSFKFSPFFKLINFLTIELIKKGQL